MGLGENKPREDGQSVGPGERSTASDRSVSPVVGIVLLFGMVFIGAAVVAGAGMMLMDDLQSATNDEQGEQVMQQAGHDLASEQGAIELLNDGQYNISEKGTINVTVTTEFGTSCALLDDEPMGTLSYETDTGGTVAHQAGGIFRQTGDGSTVISNPDIRYYTEEVNGESVNGFQISVRNLSGTAERGSHSAEYEREDISCPEVKYATGVEITVEDTPYHQGWNEFFESEFDDDKVDHEPNDRKVTVNASLGGDISFDSYVGVDPTIYGGLYVENTPSIDQSLTVDSYDGRVGWGATDPANRTEDLLVSEGSVHLQNGANISGVPVVNEELTGDSGANISTLGYAKNPRGGYIGEDNATGTPLYNVTRTYPPDVYGAKMDSRFNETTAIDGDVQDAINQIYNSSDRQGIPRNKELEVSSDESEAIYYSSGTIGHGQLDAIDTSGGIIHVAVDGNLKLSDLEVEGDGQVYFYVSGEITVDDVTVEKERASGLWIYGKSATSVNVVDEFHGVLYAPGSPLSISASPSASTPPDVYGAIAAGSLTHIDDDTDIHFDKTLRTDVPIPEANQGVELQQPGERKPVDVVFALDRSGSMELYNSQISGNDWHTPSFTGGFRIHPSESDPVEINDGGDVRTVHPGEAAVIEAGEEVRVDKSCGMFGCFPWGPSVDVSTQNDPRGLRTEAAKNFVGQMKPGDRAGAIEFNTDAYELTDHLYNHSNFDAFNASLEANANGGTYIGGGIDSGLDLYDPASDSKKVMILLTDGMNDGEDEDNEQTKEIADDAAQDEVTVYTVGLGDENDIDENLLQEIADKTGGNYTHVAEAQQLNQIFTDIGKGVQDTSVVTVEVASFEESNDWSNEFAIEVRQTTVHLDG